ncbi:MAG: TatD family hydrolase [Myxococcota bacterium]
MGWFDVHAHLTHPRVSPHLDAVVARARAAGVTSILSNGLNPTDNAAVRAAARAHSIVRPCFGFYPVDAVLKEMHDLGVDVPRDDDTPIPTAEAAITWVRDHVDEAFAVGEIGLDGYWVPEALWARQEDIFRALVRIALDADKAIIIHTRKRERRAFEVLVELGARRVVWHCFGGKVKLARQIAAHGHWLSIPANARRHQAFTRMLETLPRDRLLLETDTPYLGPDREHDNEPANVALTGQYAAELWSVPIDDVRAQFEDNYEAVFRARP